jgi:hypothetical protein
LSPYVPRRRQCAHTATLGVGPTQERVSVVRLRQAYALAGTSPTYFRVLSVSRRGFDRWAGSGGLFACRQQSRQLGDVRRNSPRLIALAARTNFSSPGKTARIKPSAGLDPLRSSLETGHPCSRSFFLALGLCSRHKKAPPLHPADTCHRDHPRSNFGEPQIQLKVLRLLRPQA